MLVYVQEDARAWAHWNHSSVIWGPQLSGTSILCFLLLSLLSGCTIGVAAAADRPLDDRHPVSILSSLRANCQGGYNAMPWWLQVLCLLIRQATFFHPHYWFSPSCVRVRILNRKWFRIPPKACGWPQEGGNSSTFHSNQTLRDSSQWEETQKYRPKVGVLRSMLCENIIAG